VNYVLDEQKNLGIPDPNVPASELTVADVALLVEWAMDKLCRAIRGER
jgi:hypothetical protein